MPIQTTHHLYPPFPSDVPTAPLVTLSLASLEANDPAASAGLFQACKDLGFFYLDMTGSSTGEELVGNAEKLHKVQQQFFKIPDEEKDLYGRAAVDPFYAYRYDASAVLSPDGKPQRNASYNIRKDDILGNCERLKAHPLVLENQDTMHAFVLESRQIIDLLLAHLETSLQLPSKTLANLHRVSERSGDHVRFLQSAIQPFTPEGARKGEHTDFGTLTILFNWLGGLQIRVPDTEDWIYVKPIPGCAVVNLGDALVKFTAGILRSNIHRVVPPPGGQYGLTRNSLVYFSRPEDKVVLRRLQGGLIDMQPSDGKAEEEMTSEEWIMRRAHGDLVGVYTHKGGLEPRKLVQV